MPQDIAKTLSFLVLHLTVGFGVAYAFTGSISMAGSIALVEPLVNAVVFFFHERAWKSGLPSARDVLEALVHRHAAQAA